MDKLGQGCLNDYFLPGDVQVALAEGIYVQHTGTLNIETTPIDAGWTVSSLSGFFAEGQGADALSLPVDEYRVRWQAAAGYDFPFSSNISITNQGHTQSIRGTYAQVVVTTNASRYR